MIEFCFVYEILKNYNLFSLNTYVRILLCKCNYGFNFYIVLGPKINCGIRTHVPKMMTRQLNSYNMRKINSQDFILN